MDIIIGGYYQGKRETAKTLFDIWDEDILVVDIPSKSSKNQSDSENKLEILLKEIEKNIIDKKCVYQIENLVKIFVLLDKTEKDMNRYLKNINLKNKVIISTDISQGVVPMDRIDRLWREWTGRLMINLSKETDSLHRVFCGYSVRIK